MIKWLFPKFFSLALASLAVFVQAQNSPAPDPARSLRLCKVAKVESTIAPTMNAVRLGVDRLIDGKLPRDGFPSHWTAWYQKNPTITFDCETVKRMGAIRIYFQARARDDELKSVKVEVSLDGENFRDFNEYGEIVTPIERGTWVEMDLKSVRARYFRLTPHFQGWGHLWGEVEFWELAD